MNMLTVLGVSLVLQYGHCMKLVDKSSAQLMGQLADQSWPSVSDLVEDVDFGFDRTLLEASEDHGSAVDDVVSDEHAKQTMETALLQMRSTSFKEALRSKSEFQTMSAAHQHQYYKGTESLRQISESPALEHFMTEAMPKLTASVKQDASFMAFLKDAAEKFPQPTDQSSKAGAPLLKELGSIAPRIAKYLMPRMQRLLKSDNHVAFLQESGEPLEEGNVDENGATEKIADLLDQAGVAGLQVEDDSYATVVPISNIYWRTQTGFHLPIPLNPSCAGACIYLDVGLLLVKLVPIVEGKFKSGPCFIILRPGFLFRMTWGLINVRVYVPTVGTKKKPVGPLNVQKYGWEAGYTYNSITLPPDDNTLQKYGGWILGTGIATKRIACPTKDDKNLDSFWFAEPMFGFKISFRAEWTFWLPMVRAGRSAEDTGHQVFAVFKPLTTKVNKVFEYPKLIGATFGQLRNWIRPPSLAGDQCQEELAEKNAEIDRQRAEKAQLTDGLKVVSDARSDVPGEDSVGGVSRQVGEVEDGQVNENIEG